MTLQLTRCPGGAGAPRRPPWWNRHPVTAAKRAARRERLAVLAGLSALFATATAAISNQPAERTWGLSAACGYGAACLIVLTVRQRGSRAAARRQGARLAVLAGSRVAARQQGARLAVLTGLTGAVLAPLAWMAATGRAQPEIGVIIRSATLFVHRGTPYQDVAALATAHNPNAYDPYLPALVMFGMPRAILGGGLLTDPRVWFGVVFVVTFGAALAVLGTPATEVTKIRPWVASRTSNAAVIVVSHRVPPGGHESSSPGRSVHQRIAGSRTSPGIRG